MAEQTEPNERREWDDRLLGDTARLLANQFGGTWQAFAPGHLVKGAPTAGWVQFTKDPDVRSVLSALLIMDEVITADLLRKIPIGAMENRRNLNTPEARAQLDMALAELPPLVRTADMDPDDFSRLVAAHYKEWAKVAPNPAAEMASRYGVKTATMHTWIREARLRHFLPPAQRKKTAREMWAQAEAAERRISAMYEAAARDANAANERAMAARARRADAAHALAELTRAEEEAVAAEKAAQDSMRRAQQEMYQLRSAAEVIARAAGPDDDEEPEE